MQDKKLVSIVIPVYNEAAILKDLVRMLKNISDQVNYIFEYIFVNDGSTDNSLNELLMLKQNDRLI